MGKRVSQDTSHNVEEQNQQESNKTLFKYAHIIPIICAVWFYITFIVTYVISVCKKDVTPVFPYISDTGTWSPESCIFGLMLNIGALIQIAIMYIRYRQVSHLIAKEKNLPPSLNRLNKVSFYLGIIAAFGVCVVGNFEETNVLEVHMLGAFAAFGCGSIYQCLQTKMSFLMYPIIGNRKINFTRVVCCIVSIITYIMTSVFAVISIQQFKGDDQTKWTKSDEGYTSHLISTITEWIMAVATIFFLLLFTHEFRKISFSEPAVVDKA